ncbi:hypothetical protein F53441_667 [Fusarium austroafricanum]|uniref:Mating type protein n=1 Tax=Fusarium austroafricanum TaxID=2364996 RepID=A0A8H4NZW2_9HYPO|nr:hypothetical protein F53441_667 [Fusarium austroafricanum]
MKFAVVVTILFGMTAAAPTFAGRDNNMVMAKHEPRSPSINEAMLEILKKPRPLGVKKAKEAPKRQGEKESQQSRDKAWSDRVFESA